MSHALCLSLCLTPRYLTAVAAQDLPKTNVKVIGLNSPTPVSIYDEVPFWRKTIPRRPRARYRRHHAARPDGHRRQDHAASLKLGVMDFGRPWTSPRWPATTRASRPATSPA
jgi:hypothetical protein